MAVFGRNSRGVLKSAELLTSIDRLTTFSNTEGRGRALEDLLKLGEIERLIQVLAPGMVILWLRSRVSRGATPELKDRVIHYAAISAAYYAAIGPLFHIDSGQALDPWLWSLLQYFLVPLMVGLALAYATEFGLEYRISSWLRLHFAHHIPAAWDYKFGKLDQGTFVLVTMRDDSRVAGLMGQDSFASSSREERDLLIEQVWEIAADGTWNAVAPSRSILICGEEIRYIEFF